MSREPVDASHNDAESALSDHDLDGVVGGGGGILGNHRGGPSLCVHGAAHAHGQCPGPNIGGVGGDGGRVGGP
jgi:hypothetical protein